MILQKLASAIRRQDWFQVTIEILIVVIGIFLGLQVTEWNETRQANTLEKKQLALVRTDIMNTLPQALIRFETREDIRRQLHQVAYFLSDTKNDIILTGEHCYAIVQSHQRFSNAPELPSLTSIELSDISNETIKNLISAYRGRVFTNTSRTLTKELNSEYSDMIKTSAEIREEDIVIAPRASVSSYNNHNCNFELMKKNTSFANDLISNESGFTAYQRQVISQLNRLEQLKLELDKELGFEPLGQSQ